MTTLKELKELDAKFRLVKETWPQFMLGSADLMNDDYMSARRKLDESARNALPDLIRVIELAEEGLDYALSQMQPFCSDEKVKQALSEIRKLKGE